MRNKNISKEVNVMDARNDNARNINYKCIIRHSDGIEEELSENLTYEELMDFLKNMKGKMEQ